MDSFSTLNTNLSLVVAQIKDKSIKRKETGEFDGHAFWTKIDGSAKQISSEATKLCLAFSQPPIPNDESCKQLVERMERATLVLVSAFYGLPESQGLYLCESTRLNVIQIIESVQKLTLTIAEDAKSGSLTQVQCTGGIWEECDNFAKAPHNNRDAVHIVAKQISALVSDALSELEEKNCTASISSFLHKIRKELTFEAQNEADDEDMVDLDPEDDLDLGSWSADDKKLLAPCTGLIKAAKSCLKKIGSTIKSNGSCDCDENIQQLDVVTDRLKDMSSLVDDFAVTLYPPMNKDNVLQEGEKLQSYLRDLLESLKTTHFILETDMKWIDFLLKASLHNWQKIQTT